MSKAEQYWTRFAPPAIIILVGLVMLASSWRKWPDPLIDFGRELYVPWQLSQGQVLYCDIAYFNGPLSPYFNALIFKIFGVGLMSLAWANIAILALVTYLAYRLLTFISSRFAATMACVAFLVAFALAQYTNTGNYNFICPYSHELTHGLLLSFAAIYLLLRYSVKPQVIFIGLAGLCLGLILLTKPEVFFAAAVALSAGLLLIFRQERPPLAGLLKILFLFIVGLIAPLVCFLLYFSLHVPLAQALRFVLFSYGQVFKGDLAAMPFYMSISGMDEPGHNLLRILIVFAWYVLLLGSLALLDWLLRRFSKHRRYIQPFVFLAGLLIGLLLFYRANWFDSLRPLPLFVVIVAGGLLIGLLRSSGDEEKRNRLTIALVLTFFSLLFLSKMILNVHAYQYGFALAAPAGMVFVVFLLDFLARLVAGKSSGGWVFKTAVSAILIVALVWHFDADRGRFSTRTQQIGQGPDMFLADPWPKGVAVGQALQTIAEQIPPDKTLLVFPEGVMLNYLGRRSSPTGYISFMPPELIMFGQENMLTALREHPPDYVVRVPRGLGEYGYDSFADYAPKLADWIEANYSPERIIGQSRRATPAKVYVYNIYLRERVER